MKRLKVIDESYIYSLTNSPTVEHLQLRSYLPSRDSLWDIMSVIDLYAKFISIHNRFIGARPLFNNSRRSPNGFVE